MQKEKNGTRLFHWRAGHISMFLKKWFPVLLSCNWLGRKGPHGRAGVRRPVCRATWPRQRHSPYLWPAMPLDQEQCCRAAWRPVGNSCPPSWPWRSSVPSPCARSGGAWSRTGPEDSKWSAGIEQTILTYTPVTRGKKNILRHAGWGGKLDKHHSWLLGTVMLRFDCPSTISPVCGWHCL